jgi:hypothetical protein
MNKIERHPIPYIVHARRNYEKALGRVDERAKEVVPSASAFPIDVTRSLIIVKIGHVVASDPREWEPSLISAAEASDCAYSVGTPFQEGLTYFDRPVRFDSKPDESMLYASGWFDAFCLNLICRRHRALQRLARTPDSSLWGSTTREPKCRLHMAHAIQAAWLDMEGRKVGELLVQAMEATDPSLLRPNEVDVVLHFDVLEIQLLVHLFQRDQTKFEQCLIEALLMHRKYWSGKDDEGDDLGAHPDSWLSLKLTGLAAAAWDAGMRFDIDSEYLPMRLVEGEFLNDLPSANSEA